MNVQQQFMKQKNAETGKQRWTKNGENLKKQNSNLKEINNQMHAATFK